MGKKKKVKSRKEKIKEYVVLHKKVLIYLSIIFALLFLFLFFTGIKIRFLLSDELNININPLSYSFSTINNESLSVDFNAKNENFIFCKASCDIKLQDLSKNITLFTEKIILGHKEEEKYSFQINSTNKGSGQNIYRFSAECNNIKSLFCFTNEEKRYRNVAIINNYDLKDSEKNFKQILKEEIEHYTSRLQSLEQYQAYLDNKIDLIPNNLLEKKQILKDFNELISKLNESKENSIVQIKYWQNEEFNQVSIELLKNDIDSLEKIIVNLEDSTNKTLIEYNQIIENLMFTSNLQKDINEIINHYYENSNDFNNKKLTNLILVLDDLDYINNFMKIKNYNVTFFKNQVLIEINLLNKSINEYETEVFKQKYYSFIYSELLNLRGENINMDIDSCNLISQIINKINETNNEPIGNETKILFNSNLTSNLNKQFISTLDYNEKYNDLLIENDLFNFIESENRTHIIIDNYLISEFNTFFCGVAKNDSEYVFNLINISNTKEITKTNFSIFDFKLDSITSKCCVFETCEFCNNNPDNNYPLLFIHGHIMNQDNSPEYSMQAFALIQKKLETSGYLDMGELKPDSYYNFDISDWGLINTPISVRASYYYVPYTILGDYKILIEKSEKIENYALRLQETIELLKEKTGKNKIRIVAHSMGGLVFRGYGALFGYDSIDKAIIINTPHHGVTEKVEKFCGVFGSDKECIDMANNSVFLNKLDKYPVFQNLYVIRSTGCDMDGVSGDGIVTNTSGYLEGAHNFEINGKCTDSLQTNLHANALDINKYPEVLDLLVEILKN